MSLVEAKGLAIAGRLETTDLLLDAGTLTALIGPNGSGKTSLLHALAGIGSSEGRTFVDGVDLRAARQPGRARIAAYVPATRALHWPISGRNLIALGGADDDEVATIIARLRLEAVVDRRVDSLSTGERSRLMIARALAPSPRLLLLDEPTANLDPLWQISMMEMMQSEVRERRCAALVAMHDLNAAALYADRLLVMCEGRVAADGPPRDVMGGGVVAEVFGVERVGGQWKAVGAV